MKASAKDRQNRKKYMGLLSVLLVLTVTTVRKFPNSVAKYRIKKTPGITFCFPTSCVKPKRINSVTLLFTDMVMTIDKR